jgi:hypothetical protein
MPPCLPKRVNPRPASGRVARAALTRHSARPEYASHSDQRAKVRREAARRARWPTVCTPSGARLAHRALRARRPRSGPRRGPLRNSLPAMVPGPNATLAGGVGGGTSGPHTPLPTSHAEHSGRSTTPAALTRPRSCPGCASHPWRLAEVPGAARRARQRHMHAGRCAPGARRFHPQGCPDDTTADLRTTFGSHTRTERNPQWRGS